MPRGVPKNGKKRRRGRRLPRVPVDHYFCTKCKKIHYKGIGSKSKYANHYVMYRERPQVRLAPKGEVVFKPLPKVTFEGKTVVLNPKKRSEHLLQAEEFLKSRVVGQDHAVDKFVNLTAKIEADICDPFKPRSVCLLLGPTGVGKTRITEALGEYFFGSRTKIVKFNCGEMASVMSFKKFGSRMLVDENIALKTKSGKPLSIILLDEIEKASRLLYKLLMGLLDRASITIDDEEVDLSHAVVVMTSNLGSNDIMKILGKHSTISESTRSRMEHAALDAAKERFTPEFFNRIDHVMVFNPLLQDVLKKIVGLEITSIEQRLVSHDIRIQCTEKAVDRILKEGTDVQYGARYLKRFLESEVVDPIAHMIATDQLKKHARVKILAKSGGLEFQKLVKEK